MTTVNVLIVVDVLAAATSGNLGANVYLVDTNKHIGSGAEGQAELVTVLSSGNNIEWSVAPIDPGTDVVIAGFEGQAINGNNIKPVKNNDGSWGSTFSATGGSGTQYQYSVSLSFDGATPQSFDPFLKIK